MIGVQKRKGLGDSWRPFYSVFPSDVAAVVAPLLPQLWVDTGKLRQQPTRQDPLGVKSRLMFEYSVQQLNQMNLMRVSVDDVWSPMLEPMALMAWLQIEHGELFRRQV